MIVELTGESITVGSCWYVWDDHQRVVAERINPSTGEREVRLTSMTFKQGKQPWVSAARVEKRAVPSGREA